jgi:zinc protease
MSANPLRGQSHTLYRVQEHFAMMRSRCFSQPAWAGAVLVMLTLPALPLRGADTPAGIRQGATVEGITEYALEKNGLKILLFPDPSASKVTVNCTVFVGSRHEGYGETGMAHLLEHMLFKGTPTHPNVPKLLRDRGADYNGTTWMDRTNYYEMLNASDDNLEFAIRLEADRLVHSYVKREDLLSEMTVVRNEFEMGENNPQNILSQRMVAIAFEWHNYGKSTIGNRSDIERVPIDKLQAFYRKYYQPDNAMLIVAGNFDPTRALTLISKYFGLIPRPRRILGDTYTDEPPQDGERSVVLRRVGAIGAVGAVYHIPAGPHESMAALDVLATMLQMQPSGQLYRALVEDSKKATSVSANAMSLHDPGYLEVVVQVDKNAPIDEVRQSMLDVMAEVSKGPISKKEVERAKLKLRKQHELLMDQSSRVGIQLSEWAAMGDWRLIFLHRDRIERVTPEDVQRVARHYLLPSNRTVGMFLPTAKPERSTIPPTPDVETLVQNYQSKESIVVGEPFEPTLANIEKRTHFSKLAGGIQTALIPYQTRGERVRLRLVLHFGNEESLKGNTTAATLLGSLMRRGTRKHSRQELQDLLDRLNAQLELTSTTGSLTCSLNCKRKDLPVLVDLLTEILRQPAFPEKEFEVLKRQRRDLLLEMRPEPQAVAGLTLQRKMAPYPRDDVRYVPDIDESLQRVEKLKLEDIRKLYDNQLGGAAGELVVIGAFDSKETVRRLEEGLQGWKASVPYRRIRRPVPEGVKPERLTLETPDKANAVYLAAQLFPLQDTEPDNAPLEVAAFVLGGGGLSSRLADRVRQKEGLSYGVGSQFGADSRDRRARLMLFAICNPTNMEKVDQSIYEEVQRLVKNGLSERELEEAKKAYLDEQKQERSNDNMLAQLLQGELESGRKLEYLTGQEKQIKALTVEEVNSAIRRHFNPKKLIIVHAGDLPRKGETKR